MLMIYLLSLVGKLNHYEPPLAHMWSIIFIGRLMGLRMGGKIELPKRIINVKISFVVDGGGFDDDDAHLGPIQLPFSFSHFINGKDSLQTTTWEAAMFVNVMTYI